MKSRPSIPRAVKVSTAVRESVREFAFVDVDTSKKHRCSCTYMYHHHTYTYTR